MDLLSTFTLTPAQLEVFLCPARFRVLVAGRRFGKTHLALVEMIMAARQAPGRLVWYVGPNDGQSRDIAWERLKKLSEPFWAKKPNESEMRIDLVWGSTLVVLGGFNPDSLRGRGVDFLVVDETASIKPELWLYALRPALADRKGRALFIGTPKGCNHFYDLYEHALRSPGWGAFQFTTAQGGLVDAEELASAALDMDREICRQEMQAEFVHIGLHSVYHGFTKEFNVKPVQFDNALPIIWALDFNINPMCMLIMQKVGEITHVLEEIAIRPHGHTQLACEQLFERTQLYYDRAHWTNRPLTIKIYGDASGNNHHTAGAKTDWEIVRNSFNMWRGAYNPEYYISSSNPPVRDRINCVNARLRNQAGDCRVFIDPGCYELIRDLEEVSWCVDSTGAVTNELNKSNKDRTHFSDALGYYITQAFSMYASIGPRNDGRII